MIIVGKQEPSIISISVFENCFKIYGYFFVEFSRISELRNLCTVLYLLDYQPSTSSLGGRSSTFHPNNSPLGNLRSFFEVF